MREVIRNPAALNVAVAPILPAPFGGRGYRMCVRRTSGMTNRLSAFSEDEMRTKLLSLGMVLLLGLLLQAPSAAVAARTELIINDLLIVLLCALFGLKTRS